jgi:hypothetical protein
MIRDGLVWLVSHDATTQEILAEWARVGQTAIVDADRAPDTRVTLELRGVSEQQALDVLLRSASGFVARQRGDASPPLHGSQQSRFDRIVVLPFHQVPIASPPDRSSVLEPPERKTTAVVGASMPPGFSPPPQAPPRQVAPAPQATPPQQANPSAQAPAEQPPKGAPVGVPVPGMIVPAPQPSGPRPEPQHMAPQAPGAQPPGPQPRRPSP